MSRSSFDHLSRTALAALLPELLLCGQLIDRSGLPHAIAAFGRDGMTAIAIEEWQLASPVYTRRMQRALGFVGDDVATIFKGLQLDIGAPPQFMDFRFRVEDRDHGEFWLDHCGALMDVEPMGEDFVVAMCHTIEDPTFDATALATNAHAQIRPIHRPPRRPPTGIPCARGPSPSTRPMSHHLRRAMRNWWRLPRQPVSSSVRSTPTTRAGRTIPDRCSVISVSPTSRNRHWCGLLTRCVCNTIC